MYTHWISPLKEQLADVQKELRNILTITASNCSDGVGGVSGAKAVLNTPGPLSSKVLNTPGPPASTVDDNVGSDDMTNDG